MESPPELFGSKDPPAILPSYIEVNEQGKLYYNGHRVNYAWYSIKHRDYKRATYREINAVWKQANSEKYIAITLVSEDPTGCPWPDRVFVGYVYD